MTIDDFVIESNRTDSVDELLRLFKGALAELGFDHVLVTLMNRHEALLEEAQFALFHSYPEQWANHYLESGYGSIDPVRILMENQQLPFSWRQVLMEKLLTEEQGRIFMEARAGGLHNGIGVPLRGPGGAVAGLAAACSAEYEERPPYALERAYLLANQFYVSFWRLKQKRASVGPDLTNKEVEVLQWSAIGLTRACIADRMNVSSHTVDFHCRNILRKYDVPNVTAAVARALSQGLISP